MSVTVLVILKMKTCLDCGYSNHPHFVHCKPNLIRAPASHTMFLWVSVWESEKHVFLYITI